tara:strand:+ start:175 stop:480 length:306 start_codon:yes stop_codon:yes gene_type:complete
LETSILLLLILLAAWFWQDSLRAREVATVACRNACRSYNMQFLDGTVAFSRLWLRRRSSGLCLVRAYQFSFSSNGADRHQGDIVVTGRQVETLSFYPPTGI